MNPLHGQPDADTHGGADAPEAAVDSHGGTDHGHASAPSRFKLPAFLQFENLPVPVQDFLNHADYVCEEIFHCKKRGSSAFKEVMLGLVQFISCVYILPVVPEQLEKAGYERVSSIVSTCLTCALGCIIGGVLTNMPFIVAPPTSVSIFLSVFLQQQNLGRHQGNVATLMAGVGLLIIGVVRPLGSFITRLIPDCIQASTSVGIGLITALAGATEVHLVVRGKYTVLDMGEITPEILIAMAAVIIVSVALHYHIKGAFCLGLIFGTIVWWIYVKLVPELYEEPHVDKDMLSHESFTPMVVLLIFDLLFLNILTLNGLARANSGILYLYSLVCTYPWSDRRPCRTYARQRSDPPRALAVHRVRPREHRQRVLLRPARAHQPRVSRGHQGGRQDRPQHGGLRRALRNRRLLQPHLR